MSTRCNIIIKDRFNRRVYLYHHHDGYPEGVGEALAEYLHKWQDWQIRQHGMRYIPNELVRGEIKVVFTDWKTGEATIQPDLGYDITAGIHGDIEYLYIINCKAGTLRCYKVGWNDVDGDFNIDLRKVLRRRNLRPIPGWDFIPEDENRESAA